MAMDREKETKLAQGIYRRGSSLYVRFRFQDRTGAPRYLRRTLGPDATEDDAKALRDKWRSEARRLGYVAELERPARPTAEPAIPFRRFATVWFERHVVPNNRPSQHEAKRSSLDCYLVPFFGDTDIRAIDEFAVDALKAGLLRRGVKKKDGLSRASVNRHLGILRSMLNMAKEWRMIAEVPRIRDLKVEQRDRDYYNIEERDHFLAVCRERRPEWYPFFVLAFHSGMQTGELAALRWEDVDFFGRTIRVRRTNWRGHEGPPKGKRARTIPMNSLVYETLKAHRHLGELVFTNSVGKPLDINGGYKTFKTLCRLAGLRALRRHDIRHTFASNLAALTGNLLAVKEILGHVDYATTLRYAHLTPNQFADAVEALVTKSDGERAGAVDASGRRG